MSINKPAIITFDFEGVFIPEVWIAVAEATQIEELRLTTRDITDYDELMQYRIKLLTKHDIKLKDIQDVIATMDVLPGAAEFLAWVRSQTQALIITDSYYPFIGSFLAKLNHPTAFAHTLEISDSGHISDYKLRTTDGKRKVVASLKEMGFRTMAVGDSYNDTTMLLSADNASLYCPPQNVIDDFPQLKVANNYAKLTEYIEEFLG